jgi:hypothetical protein
MRGSLRITSLTGLALFIGWSLLAQAREWIASPVASAKPSPSSSRTPVPSPSPAVDRRLLN